MPSTVIDLIRKHTIMLRPRTLVYNPGRILAEFCHKHQFHLEQEVHVCANYRWRMSPAGVVNEKGQTRGCRSRAAVFSPSLFCSELDHQGVGVRCPEMIRICQSAHPTQRGSIGASPKMHRGRARRHRHPHPAGSPPGRRTSQPSRHQPLYHP